MDPPTVLAVLQLQLNDINELLNDTPTPTGERASFEAMRAHLLSERTEVFGRYAARRILREENANHATFRRLVGEERQAEVDHRLARRLVGRRALARVATAVETAPPVEEVVFAPEAVSIPETASVTQVVPMPEVAPIPEVTIIPDVAQAGPAEDEAGSVDISEATTAVEHSAEDDQTSDSKTIADTFGTEQLRTDVGRNEPSVFQYVLSTIGSAILREDEKSSVGQLCPGESTVPSPKETDETSSTTNSTASSDSYTACVEKASIDPGVKCTSCLDLHDSSEVINISCASEDKKEPHSYCRDCLVRMFDSSIKDSSLFPPRCCSKEISLSECGSLLPRELIIQFEAKKEEFDTPNKTYCSDPECAKWIRPESIMADVATCEGCRQRTCAVCKGKQHNGLCSEDETVQSLMSMAKKRKWQTCSNCRNMVELSTGCYHISCRCGHQFCYLCAAKWKTCRCEHADEQHVMNQVRQQVHHVPREADPVRREVNIRREDRNRRENNVHVHDYRRAWDDPTTCDDCGDNLPWILHCQGCNSRLCAQCRGNRRLWE